MFKQRPGCGFVPAPGRCPIRESIHRPACGNLPYIGQEAQENPFPAADELQEEADDAEAAAEIHPMQLIRLVTFGVLQLGHVGFSSSEANTRRSNTQWQSLHSYS